MGTTSLDDLDGDARRAAIDLPSNDLCHWYLNSTAFHPENSMSATNAFDGRDGASPNAYGALANTIPMNIPLISNPNIYAQLPNEIDFKKYGILFELPDAYWIVRPRVSTNSHGTVAKNDIWRGWMKKPDVGHYLKLEWAAIATINICNGDRWGKGMLLDSESGWQCHDKVIQDLRAKCASKASDFTKIFELKPEAEASFDERGIRFLYRHAFSLIVDNEYAMWAIMEDEEKQDAECAFEDFVLFD